MTELALVLHIPMIQGSAAVDSFGGDVVEYEHAITRMGGFYEASWFMPLVHGRNGNSAMLRRWFETPYLMYHLRETMGGALTWTGGIWEMELTLDGLTKRVSMEDVYNAVKGQYTDEDGALQETSWYTDADSIATFGRREQILTGRYVSDSEAQAEAQAYLKTHAWPWPQVVEIATERREGLFVQAIGYAATANFQYVGTTAADGTTGNISAFISAIISNDCEFLQAGDIETNTLQRKRLFDREIRCWDAIEELTEMGDSNNDPWVAQNVVSRRLNYVKADSTPRYFWQGPGKGVTSGAGGLNGWEAQPGVMRDLTSPNTAARPSSFLEQARDVWIEEVRMAQGNKTAEFIPAGFDPMEIIRTQRQYLRWMERQDEE